VIDRDQLPEAIEQHPQLVRECPATAPAMYLKLPVQ
jgi:hypothetical protein